MMNNNVRRNQLQLQLLQHSQQFQQFQQFNLQKQPFQVINHQNGLFEAIATVYFHCILNALMEL